LTKFNFAISFRPTNIRNTFKQLGGDFEKNADRTIKKLRDTMQHEMQRAAPGPAFKGKLGSLPLKYGPNVDRSKNLLPRSGRLRRSIKPLPFVKSGGKLNKRVALQVQARSPHAKFVIAGVKSNTGEGGKGRGAFFPGVRKRGRYGTYPGFQAYDFVTEAREEVAKEIGPLQTKFLKAMQRNFKGRIR
jgi:hypothetical protein